MSSPRRRSYAGIAALVVVALVIVAAGVVVVTRVLDGGECGEVLGDVETGEAAGLAWSPEPEPAVEATGAIEALEGTEAVGGFRGAIAVSPQAGGTTIISSAVDSIVAIALSTTAENQVARAFRAVAPDDATPAWAREFSTDLVTTSAGAGTMHALGLDDDGLDVVAVEAATGAERWCQTLGGSGDGAVRAVSADRTDGGDVVVGRFRNDDGGALVARLGADDGDSLWEVGGDDLPVPARLVAADDLVSFGGLASADERPAFAPDVAPSAIVGLAAADGAERWRYEPETGPDVQWHPYLVGAAEGVTVVLEQPARRVVAGPVTAPRLVGIDADGTVRWTQPLDDNLDVRSEDVLVEGSVVVLAGARQPDGARPLVAYDVADGAEAWAADLRTGVLRRNRVAVSNGWLLTAGLAGVEAVNLESGATETVLDGVPVPDIAAEEGGLVAVEVAGSILVFDTPA